MSEVNEKMSESNTSTNNANNNNNNNTEKLATTKSTSPVRKRKPINKSEGISSILKDDYASKYYYAPISSDDFSLETTLSTKEKMQETSSNMLTKSATTSSTHTRPFIKSLLGPSASSILKAEFYASLEKPPSARTPLELDRIYKNMKGLVSFEMLESEYKVRELCKVMNYEKYKEGDIVFRQGDAAQYFYIVYRGSVGVSIDTSSLIPTPSSPSIPSLPLDKPPQKQEPKVEKKTEQVEKADKNDKDKNKNKDKDKDKDKGKEKDIFTEPNPVVLIKGDMFGHFALGKDKGRNATIIATSPITELLSFDAYTYQRLVQFSVERGIEENTEFLRRFPLFQTLPVVSIVRLAEVIRPRKYKHGEVIFEVGDPLDGVYFVQRGCFIVQKMAEVDTPKGKVEKLLTIRKLKAGSFFGEMEMFSKSRRTVTVVCANEEEEQTNKSIDAPKKKTGESPLCLFISKFDFMKRATLTLVQTMHEYIEREYPTASVLQKIYEEEKVEKRWIEYKKKLVNNILSEAKTKKPSSTLS